MPRNKKIKNEYYKKRKLLEEYNFYFAKNKKLPVSSVKYKVLKDEISSLEARYPSIKKLGDDLLTRADQTYPDGRRYQGAIKSASEQIPHGHGYMFLSKFDTDPESKTFHKKLTDDPWDYTGEFKDGVFDGKGEFKSKGHYTYKGEWKNSYFHGKGKFIDEKLNETYEGDFLNDKKHGFGICLFDGYTKYEGEFKNGEKSGKGKTTILKDFENFKKGTIYEGSYKNDSLQGYCKIIYPDGEIIEGTWNKGKFKEKKQKK